MKKKSSKKKTSYQNFMKLMKQEYEKMYDQLDYIVKPKWFDKIDEDGNIVFDLEMYNAALIVQSDALQELNARYKEFKKNSKQKYEEFLSGYLVMI